MPVDSYIGGMEHALLHLLYSRFIYKFLIKLGIFKNDNSEPFKHLITQVYFLLIKKVVINLILREL